MEFWEDYETLRIETPEGLDLYLPLAGFGPRFLAFFIDMLIVSVGQVILIFVGMAIAFAGAFGAAGSPGVGWVMTVVLVVMLLVLLFAPVLYFMVFEGIWNGQSPGKRVAGIRVVRRGGYPVAWRDVIWRNILRLIDMQPLTNCMVGLVSFFATHNQQRVGDLLADTVVVREFAGKAPLVHAPQSAVADVRAVAPGTLTPAVSYVIGSYLQRAGELDDESRERLSRRCIEALGYSGQHLSREQREVYLATIMQGSWAAGQA